MRFLILSDIHANRHALEAVVADAGVRYDRIVCLGDIVGYGAEPNATSDWVRTNVPVVVRGNHDRACTGDAVIEEFSDNAYQAAQWTLPLLTEENCRWLTGLPRGPVPVEDFFLCHGSPADEDEYVTSTYEAAFQYRYLPAEVCFFGHTHLQGTFAMRPGKAWYLDPSSVLAVEPDTAYLINPGSVGQPRDHDPRAAYAVYDSDARIAEFRRVKYDIAGAQKAIREAGLPEYLASRLAQGR
ncbi:MAG: metallophosphoesterase family protein [Bryobacterales bacterium]|nr:metallophosphoesterase family protein [Bryobacterales bacterium]